MNSPDPLDALLATWRISPARNPQFRAKVWERMQNGGAAAASSTGAQTWLDYLRRNGGSVVAAFALALLAGAFSGSLRARADVAADNSRIAAAYVKALDARNMRMP
jgi:hypothetical protein